MNRITLIGCLFWSCFANAQQLILKAENFASDEGKAVFMIYRSNDALPKAPFKTIVADIVNGKANAFALLPFGDYAIILIHDKNANGKVDHSFGYPSEPLGYSNGWRFTLFSGMPTFEKLKFTFSQDMTEQIIPITYKK